MNQLRLTVLLFLGVCSLISCQEIEHPPTTGGEELEPPKIIISVQEAEDLYHNYGNIRVPLIEQSVNITEEGEPIDPEADAYIRTTRSLSVDYKVLKEYLAFIEQQAGNAKTEITGLRIYFGKYADSENDGRATIFMNPTMEFGAEGSINDDISFAIKKDGAKSIAVPVAEVFTVPKEAEMSMSNRADLMMTIQDPIQSLAANRMEWRPPPPPPIDPDYQ